jgi:hypothetical protein
VPELTLDTITARTRALASRTSDQVTRTMGGLLPRQVTRPTRANRLQQLLQGVQDRVDATPLGRTRSPAQKAGRQAHKVPQRTRNQIAFPDMGDLLQRGALVVAGTRLATDWVQRMRRAAPGGKQGRAINVNMPSLPGRGRIMTRGAKTSARAATGVARTGAKTVAKATTGAARAGYRVGVGVGTAKTAMKMAKPAGRGWWLSRRAQVQQPLRATQRRMRRVWRRLRAFTIGFATGAIWAYLFAPRQGPGSQRQQEGTQRTA